MKQNLIECRDVSFSYNGVEHILKGIYLQVGSREPVGIIGANGAGKSTLLRVLIGLELNYNGEISINEISVGKKTLTEIRANVGYLFQESDDQLFNQSVYQEVAFGLRNYGMEEKQAEVRVMETLKAIGIEHLKDKKIYNLSGGEKKMAAIASILAMKPELLLLDEPSIALDPKNRRALIRILNNLEQSKLVASHDLDLILETCDRVILLSEGRIVCDGPAEIILRDRELLEAHGLELPLCLGGYRGH
jgi:cobalt/nickel transport system ATP-binding protein